MGGGRAESELFTWPSAQLFLVEGAHHKALLQSGPFSILLTTHSRCPYLALVEASVSDLRWPVGKDSLVTIFDFPSAPARFLFAFLGHEDLELVYELQLLNTPSNDVHISRLQTLLQLYASVRIRDASNTSALHAGPPTGVMKELEEAAGKYWAGVAAEQGGFEEKNGRVDLGCRKEAEEQEVVRLCLGRLQGGSHEGNSSNSLRSASMSSAGISKRMMKKIQKARRVSAVVKLLSKTMVRGVISGGAHVVQELASGEGEATGRMPSSVTMDKVMPSVAKVDAITRVVEAVERGVPEDGNEEQVTWSGAAVNRLRQSKAVDISSNLATWTLNELGLQLLVNVVFAANYMRVPAKARPSKSSSSSSLNSLLNDRHVYSGTLPATASNSLLIPARHRPPRAPRSSLLSEASSLRLVVNSSNTIGQSSI